jgi:hypothetical protein
MKITRISGWTSPFGRVEFVPALPGVKVLWQKAGQVNYRLVYWGDKLRPTLHNARFFIRKAVAEDQGKPPYFYSDQNIDPPST